MEDFELDESSGASTLDAFGGLETRRIRPRLAGCGLASPWRYRGYLSTPVTKRRALLRTFQTDRQF